MNGRGTKSRNGRIYCTAGIYFTYFASRSYRIASPKRMRSVQFCYRFENTSEQDGKVRSKSSTFDREMSGVAVDKEYNCSREGGHDRRQLLREHGNAGHVVCKAIASALNLPSSMEASLTSGSNFAALGGDSLAATRVVRSLYASHYSLVDGRKLGGQYGQLDGAFSVQHLLSARTLGSYVDWLDSHGVCASSVDLPYMSKQKRMTNR